MDEPRPGPDPVPTGPTVDAGPGPATTWRDRLDLLGADELPAPLRWGGVVLVTAGLAAGAWLLLRDPPPPAESTLPMAAPADALPASPPEVVVQAAGAVQRPGLYRLADGARVADLVEAAGGPAADADVDRVNLAARVVDGTQVRVPRVGEPAAATEGGAPTADAPLDLNSATVDQLDELPGVGPTTAAAIVAERSERGRFRSVDELEEVRGIGPPNPRFHLQEEWRDVDVVGGGASGDLHAGVGGSGWYGGEPATTAC